MIIRFLFAGIALAFIALAGPVGAATDPSPGRDVQAAILEDRSGLQLAQNRDVEVVIDERGRQLLVDRRTREVIGVLMDREQRDWREEPRSGGYRLDDPGDMERFRRDREILLGTREPPAGGSMQDYSNRPDPWSGGVYDPNYRDVSRYPEAPQDVNPLPGDWRDISRQPLDEPREQAATPSVPDFNEGPSDIIIDSAVPPVTGSVPDQSAALPDAGEGAPAVVVNPGSSQSETRQNVARIQILLDRMHISPGVIDGRMGDNVNKAISAYREMTGRTLRTYDTEAIEKALEDSGGPAFTDYEITPEDAAGPFVASVPDDYGEKARLDRLSYTSVEEKLAERFHMDINYLKSLNPGANFTRPGTIIRVANTAKNATGKVTRIEADKSRKQVRAYGADGRLVTVYPATIGSAATPSPTGTHTVERVALNPEYTYNPKINFKQGDNDRVLTIPPGPNGPVGTVWIALSKPTYGIHGTPDPSKIGKTESNGCIRLTNWDAEELARLVEKGATVEFLE